MTVDTSVRALLRASLASTCVPAPWGAHLIADRSLDSFGVSFGRCYVYLDLFGFPRAAMAELRHCVALGGLQAAGLLARSLDSRPRSINH